MALGLEMNGMEIKKTRERKVGQLLTLVDGEIAEMLNLGPPAL